MLDTPDEDELDISSIESFDDDVTNNKQ